jgi:L-xylulokinase
MAGSRYYLGIDNGGTLSKAALFDAGGRELAQSHRKTALLQPKPGHTERDMGEMWEATAAAIREVLQKSGVSPGNIAAVAATGHGNGLYLIDEDGRPSRNGIISTDSRALPLVEAWEREGVLDAVLPKTMQSVWAGSTVSLLAWLNEHETEVLARSGHVLMAKDYTRYRLCGEIQAEITDMSGTNLLNVRDRRYDGDLLEAFGLAHILDKLPPLRRSTEVCGRVTARAAAATGLLEGTPVAGGLFDIDAAAIAAGVVDETRLSLVAGTWSINQFISPRPVVRKGLFMTSIYCMDGYWLVCEGSPTSASNLEWFVTQFISEAEASAATGSDDIFGYVEKLVAQSSSEDANIVFLPFIFGSNVVADAKCAFVGLCGWHTRSHMLRSIYEGVVFGHKSHISRLAAVGSLPKAARIAGGAARSKLWMQMFADALQMPIEVTANSELGALGAALCARVASGDSSSLQEAAAAMVSVDRIYRPDPAAEPLFQRKYANYLDTIDTLSPLWKRLV